MTEWYQAYIIRSLRRVLRDKYNIKIPLLDTFNTVKSNYKTTVDMVINDIMTKDKYLGKSIIPIQESYVVVEEENKEEEKVEVGIKKGDKK